MKNVNKNITTWEKLLDFLDICDADDIIIYVKLETMSIPVDNFELMRIASSKNPKDETFLSIEEDEFGKLYLV